MYRVIVSTPWDNTIVLETWNIDEAKKEAATLKRAGFETVELWYITEEQIEF